MESTSFTLSVKQEAAPRPKRKAKKRAVWPHLLMQAFLAAVLLYLGIMIAQSVSIHTTGAGNVVLAVLGQALRVVHPEQPECGDQAAARPYRGAAQAEDRTASGRLGF